MFSEEFYCIHTEPQSNAKYEKSYIWLFMPHRLLKDQFSRHPKVNRGEGWVFLQVVRFLIQFGWYNFPAQERHIRKVSGRYQDQQGIFRCWTIRGRKYSELLGRVFPADVQKLIYVASLPTILLYFNAIFIDIIRGYQIIMITHHSKSHLLLLFYWLKKQS